MSVGQRIMSFVLVVQDAEIFGNSTGSLGVVVEVRWARRCATPSTTWRSSMADQ